MWDAKRAINTVAVLNGLVVTSVRVMALLAEVVRAKAAVDGHAAAELALPVDLCRSVLGTSGRASSDPLEQAVLAKEVLLSGLLPLSVSHLLFAVDKAAEVGLAALATFVEGASLKSILLLLAEVIVSLSCHTTIAEDALLLGTLNCHLFYLSFQLKKRSEHFSNRLTVKHVDRCLACRATHETEADSQGWIAVLEQLDYTIYVKYVTTSQLSARFFFEFARVADTTELVLFGKVTSDTSGIEAWQHLLITFMA